MESKLASASSKNSALWALVTGGFAALLASACCLGPLVLITLGVSGAWISHLTELGPMQPVFVGAAVFALLLAWRRIWRPVSECGPGKLCALSPVHHTLKLLFVVVVLLVLVALLFPFIAPWFY